MPVFQPTAILLYHRVSSPARDVHRLCVAPERFAAHVEHLRRNERVVPLADARRRSRHRRVVLTFDDGYADNALVASDILERASLPVTFFITVGLVGIASERWWDELELLLFEGEPRDRHLDLDIAGSRLIADVGSDAARRRTHDAVYRRLRPLHADQIDAVIGQLRQQIETTASPRESHRFMTADELQQLASTSGVDIGGHAVTHQTLSSLSPEAQRREIVDGRAALRSLTGRAVEHFAYPFGAKDTFDETSEELVADAGYRMACAGWPGVVHPRTPVYRLPRIVVGNWSVDELRARLARFF